MVGSREGQMSSVNGWELEFEWAIQLELGPGNELELGPGNELELGPGNEFELGTTPECELWPMKYRIPLYSQLKSPAKHILTRLFLVVSSGLWTIGRPFIISNHVIRWFSKGPELMQKMLSPWMKEWLQVSSKLFTLNVNPKRDAKTKLLIHLKSGTFKLSCDNHVFS